jgi:hypothetical protein
MCHSIFLIKVLIGCLYFNNSDMKFLYQTGSSSDADLERQMHTDAAQSVLEMGYTPHVIRSALRALRDGNGTHI